MRAREISWPDGAHRSPDLDAFSSYVAFSSRDTEKSLNDSKSTFSLPDSAAEKPTILLSIFGFDSVVN